MLYTVLGAIGAVVIFTLIEVFILRVRRTKTGQRVVNSNTYHKATREIKVHWIIKLIILIVLGLILGIVITKQPSEPLSSPTTPVQSETVQTTTQKPITPPTPSELLELTNAERAKVGVKPLKLDERLNQSAQWKADDMEQNNYYSHISPITGKQGYELVWEYIEDCYPAENINQFGLQGTSKELIMTWMNSKPHKETILNNRYTLTGFGITKDYAVQHFCDL